MNRRDILKGTGLAAAGFALSPFLASALRAESTGPKKKVLFFTKSEGFQHSPIAHHADDPTKLAYAEQIVTDLGAENGFEVTCSKDGSLFTPEYLKGFDVILFYTTGDLRKDSDKYATKKDENGKNVPDKERVIGKEPGMGDAGKAAFLEAIENGVGFIGFHSATDTFHSSTNYKENMLRDVDEAGKDKFDPYIQMIGGEFIIHGSQQKATLKTIDPKFPGAEAFNDASFVEEWYSLKNFSPDLHVILAQDCTGMKGLMYERGLYPETWARMNGKGRVFYTSMGHREDVWKKPEFVALLIGALNWTSKKVDVDVTPNLKQATPEGEPKVNTLKK